MKRVGHNMNGNMRVPLIEWSESFWEEEDLVVVVARGDDADADAAAGDRKLE